MKRFIGICFSVILFMVFSPTLFAQGGGLTPAVDNPPVFDFGAAFQTFAALVAFIPMCVGVFKKIFVDGTHSLIIQIFSWCVGIVISMIGWGLHLGFLAGLTWYIALAYGFAASLAANGVADTGIIQAILAIFIPKKPMLKR